MNTSTGSQIRRELSNDRQHSLRSIYVAEYSACVANLRDYTEELKLERVDSIYKYGT
jgi:hypothetical protein